MLINECSYSGFTSTKSDARQTVVTFGSENMEKLVKVYLLLEQNTLPALTDYTWKIPLLKNAEEVGIPFRANVTVWSY